VVFLFRGERCQKVSAERINPRKLISKSKTKVKTNINTKIARNVRKHENPQG